MPPAGRFCFAAKPRIRQLPDGLTRMTEIITITDYPVAAATRIRPSANADNTDSVIGFLHSGTFCLSVSIRSLPPAAVIRGPLLLVN